MSRVIGGEKKHATPSRKSVAPQMRSFAPAPRGTFAPAWARLRKLSESLHRAYARRQAEQRARTAMLHPRARQHRSTRRIAQVSAIAVFVLALGFAWVDFEPRSVHAIVPPVPKPKAADGSAPAEPAPPAAAIPGRRASADLVVLVSLDGLRPDVITPNMRALHRLYLQGASPHFARTIDKSATLPSHASMVSGVDPEQHGLDFNAYKPERGVISRPTVFSVAHAAGMPTTMFVGKSKLKHLLGKPTDADFQMGGMVCEKLLKLAIPHLRKAERGLFFLHFADPDSAGHRNGWMTDEYIEASHQADACLERVIETIERGGRADRTLLMVTSDHGGHKRSHGTKLDEDQRIPWYAWGAGVRRGRVSRTVHTTDTAATALAALGLELPDGMHGQPVKEALGNLLGPAGLPMVGKPLDHGAN